MGVFITDVRSFFASSGCSSRNLPVLSARFAVPIFESEARDGRYLGRFCSAGCLPHKNSIPSGAHERRPALRNWPN